MRQDLIKRIAPSLWLGLATLTLPVVALLAQTSAPDAAKTTNKTETTTQKATGKAARVPKPEPAELLEWPPKLPGGVEVAVDESPELLVKPERVKLLDGVEIAKTAPRIEFSYYSGQDKFSKLWSVWGDGVTSGTKYYSTLGNHDKYKEGRAQVYEYDSASKKMRLLVDTLQFLEESGELPEDMQYRPGKIHSRIDLGSDGWLYYATHRGSDSTTTDAYGYKGDWVFRTHPETGKTEIVAAYPVPKHAIPGSVLDPERMIFYGGTKAGEDSEHQDVRFFAYDVKNRKLLKTAPTGFNRYAILSTSTGAVYWRPRDDAEEQEGAVPGVKAGAGRKYDSKTNTITEVPAAPEVRAATSETKDGLVYGVSDRNADLWVFDVKNETLKQLGPGAVATQQYVTSIDVDPSGRYVYYIPGAHGGGIKDGTPIVQYDTKTNTRKIIAFLSDYYTKKYNYAPDGSFGSALSPDGSTLYITWNGVRAPNSDDWDTVAMTAIHIPASERQP